MQHVTAGSLSDYVDEESNAEVLAWLDANAPSCHSDLGEAMLVAAAGCGDCTAYSPSFVQCRYVAFITNRRVFAIGKGQGAACYRVPDELLATALSSGAESATELGAGWVRFIVFNAKRPAPDLPFWTLRAYAAARA